ncbi:hypothetical protein [Chromohalobacter israelensis]|uniref:Uncharacterized protein n=1 Tax=Chromohalobacter israelensis (strain ATCC BAA-138 / DSM 3043 / CIP 106854 / NCIMB 13768 / 1H11) TaxID=290398 RepID=Q1QXS9_CHRI1|nr:hypothetical protein [Chromohalobacter salexigens]ABE58729.1 hypothetical protein Csal_1374 [Chromohalobacter salexigens DSM 3043]
MSVERPDQKAKNYMITMGGFFVAGISCWLGFGVTVGFDSLFREISEKSTVIVGLISAPAIVASLALKHAESRRYMATSMAFFLIALLALLLIIMSPLESVMPEDGEHAGLWILGLPALFITDAFVMIGSLMMTLRAHMLEGEGEVIPYPSTKSDVER